MQFRRGFTIIEIIVIVAVIAILATLVVLGYSGWKHHVELMSVQSDVTEGANSLEVYKNFKNSYPPNLAGANFAGSPYVALALWTNAPGVPSYTNLTPDQNAQLFLNACNAYMPITSGGTTYNTACTYAGINMHVSGQNSSNVVLHGPTINATDFTLTCGNACTTAQNTITAIFQQQGGTWPISVPKGSVALPAATSFSATGPATSYCLQGTSPDYSDIVYHISSGGALQSGPCPNNGSLHYP